MCAWDGVTAWERGERQLDSQWHQGGSFESLPGSLLATTQRSMVTCDGQILNQMSGVGTSNNIIVQMV